MDPRTAPEDCLQTAIDAAGGNKIVGAKLRPEMDPIEAGKWLSRCLDPAHKQRLNYAQERLVYALACRQGEHEGFRAYAASIGYQVQAIDVSAEVQALAERAERLAKQSADLSAEAMSRMKAAGINVGAIQ